MSQVTTVGLVARLWTRILGYHGAIQHKIFREIYESYIGYALYSALRAAVGRGPLGCADSGGDTQSLAKAAQNPVANLISVPFQNNTDFNACPKEKTLNTLNIQPVLPFEVSENWNIITRTIIPVISQPERQPGQDRETGIPRLAPSCRLPR